MKPKTLGNRFAAANARLSLGLAALALAALGLVTISVVGFVGLPSPLARWVVIWIGYLFIPAALFGDRFVLRRIQLNAGALFTYFVASRLVLAAVVSAYLLAQAGNLDSSYVPPVIAMLWAIFVAVSGLAFFKDNRSPWKLAAILAVAAGTIVANGFVVAIVLGYASPKLSGQHIDSQTSYDFQLLRQDIQSAAMDNGVLPPANALGSIAQTGVESKSEDVSRRVAKYTYIPLQSKGTFQLCAEFYTNTLGAGQPMGDEVGNEDYHHAGYQCITYPVQY